MDLIPPKQQAAGNWNLMRNQACPSARINNLALKLARKQRSRLRGIQK
jgi:hypothetical protein